MIWEREVWDLDFWAVPAITENRDAALAFVRFATSTEALARQTRWIPYGPVRRSSLALVGDYVHADVEMARYLPTAEANFETALRNDALFWRDVGDRHGVVSGKGGSVRVGLGGGGILKKKPTYQTEL